MKTILIAALMITAATAQAQTGSIVANPKQDVGTTGGTVTASGYVAGQHYTVNCNDIGCSEAAGLELVAKLADGRYMHLRPVLHNQEVGKGGNPLRSLHTDSTFTYYEKPLKGYTDKHAMQFCTPGVGGQDACYVEAAL